MCVKEQQRRRLKVTRRVSDSEGVTGVGSGWVTGSVICQTEGGERGKE